MGRKATNLDSLLEKTKLDMETGCRIWQGSLSRDGRYGSCSYLNKTERAHRVSYTLAKGPIPVGSKVLHTCDIPLCINPEHLFLGSDADNVIDKVNKNRHAKGIACNHPHRIFDNNSVLEVRKLYVDGVPRVRLAEKYNTSITNITNIVTYKTWKHVL